MDFNNDKPIYLQIVSIIKQNIISGHYKCNEKLPSVRDLALNLKVNSNTVQKALGNLEMEGLIYTERTSGKYVTDNEKLINKCKKEEFIKSSDMYLESVKKLGFSTEEVIKYLKERE